MLEGVSMALQGKHKKETLRGYLFVTPVILLLLVFSFYPLLRTVYLSFFDVRLASMNRMNFIGWKNYIALFARTSPDFFKQIIPATLIYVAGSVVGQIGFGFLLAILLQQKFVKGREFFRGIIILPWVVSGIIIAISWRFMYEPRLGIINHILLQLGNTNPPTWLNSERLVMGSLIVANIWHGMAFSFIIQTSGLHSISEELMEAAMVDGASAFQRLIYITIPLVRSFLVLNLILTSMATINSFDLIYAMTNGGPLFRTEVISVHMYHRAFDFGRLGEGSAVATIILLMNLFLTIFYLRINKRKKEEAEV
ncbi:MAG: sugar ABC transporter permease [Bacilli bacterium]|jgi:ABC-type sugar transport system permease subunit|nr:sugar ABC transporter permease [Bacilli bacterium]